MQKRADIDHVIFDFGMVLFSYTPWEYTEQIFGDKELGQKVYKASFGSKFWPMLDNGDIGEDEALDRMIETTPGLEKEIRTAMSGWPRELLIPIPEMTPWPKRLKEAGYHVHVLSNISANAFRYVFETMDFLSPFEQTMASAVEKMSKPDIRLFHLMIKRFQIDPSRSVFIDDQLKNIISAREAGLHTIHLTDYKSMEEYFYI